MQENTASTGRSAEEPIEWQASEDARIIDMRNGEGAFWVAIAKTMTRRPVTPLQVRQRYDVLMQLRLTGTAVQSGERLCLKCQRRFKSQNLKKQKICKDCHETNAKIGDACMETGRGIGGYSLNEGCRTTMQFRDRGAS